MNAGAMLEAVLLASPRPVSLRALASATGIPEGEALVAGVIDDGRGFDPASPRAGVGLSAMRERVESLGGEIEVQSPAGEGTKVTVRVPLGGGTPSPPRL